MDMPILKTESNTVTYIRTHTYAMIVSENNFPRHYQPLSTTLAQLLLLLRLTAHLHSAIVYVHSSVRSTHWHRDFHAHHLKSSRLLSKNTLDSFLHRLYRQWCRTRYLLLILSKMFFKSSSFARWMHFQPKIRIPTFRGPGYIIDGPRGT